MENNDYYDLFFGESDDDCVCNESDDVTEECDDLVTSTSEYFTQDNSTLDCDFIFDRQVSNYTRPNKKETNCYKNRRRDSSERKTKRKLHIDSSEEERLPKRRRRYAKKRRCSSLKETKSTSHGRHRKRRSSGSTPNRRNYSDSDVRTPKNRKPVKSSENRILKKLVRVIQKFLKLNTGPKKRSCFKRRHVGRPRKKKVSINLQDKDEKPMIKEIVESNANEEPVSSSLSRPETGNQPGFKETENTAQEDSDQKTKNPTITTCQRGNSNRTINL